MIQSLSSANNLAGCTTGTWSTVPRPRKFVEHSTFEDDAGVKGRLGLPPVDTVGHVGTERRVTG